MGIDTIPNRTNGQTIDQLWFNIIKSVITVDNVPRNVSGVVTAAAGSLGTSTYDWLESYIRTMYFGLVAQGCSLSVDGAGDIVVKRNSLEVGKFTANGLDGSDLVSNSISPTKLIDKAITTNGTDPGIGGVCFSSDTGYFSTGSTSYVDVTNAACTLTTTGRPIFIGLIPNAVAGNQSYISANNSVAEYQILEDTTAKLAGYQLLNSGAGDAITTPPGALWGIIAPSSGSHTYKLQAKAASANNARVAYSFLVAYEL